MPMLIEIMPAQDVHIETGGADDPVQWYKLEENQKIPLDPKDIYHSRCFLNIDFSDGKCFRGLSPLKVAANIIEAMNNGDKTTRDIAKSGMPPFMLVNEDLDTEQTEEQKRLLEKAWREKAKDIPILGGGHLKKLDLGFSSLRDLMIAETDARGLRIICNIWGVHVSIFSDEHATENNIRTARQLMYEDRIIPDVNAELEFYNELFAPAGIHYEADWSKIPALQEDKEKLAKIYAIGRDKRAVTRNEFRRAIGEAEIDDPAFTEDGLIEEAMFTPDVLSNFNDNNNQNNNNRDNE